MVESHLFCTTSIIAFSGQYVEEKKTDSVLSKNEKFFLAFAAPLWVPIAAAAGILFLPVGVGVLIKESMNARQTRRNYMTNKAAFMRDWTDEVMNGCFSKDNIKQFVLQNYLTLFQKSISNLCNDYIPKQIAADMRQVNNIANDRRTSQEILKVFKPFQTEIRELQAKVMFFKLQYMSEDLIYVKDLQRVIRVGDGTYSEVYLTRWHKGIDTITVALKVLKSEMKGLEMHTQLSEVECLRYNIEFTKG